jgi:dGTPase
MDWNELLSARKLGRSEQKASPSRSPFQQDADLVVFSAAFRRLQDKTQVHPLTEGGHVRTRLTHSIEVASVGRSLGTAVAPELRMRHRLDADQGHAFAHLVHAACLAHDIGNPPFGHGGEDAIQLFFRERPALLDSLSAPQREDFKNFDGNAQGFRIVTQLENHRFAGGLRLTHGTLGAFMKYVVPAAERRTDSAVIGERKPGFFMAEAAYVAELQASLGLPDRRRHPLVYLTEAADDICYAIVDLEDGHDAGLVEHRDAVEVISEIARAPADGRLSRDEQLHKLRGLAIGQLVDEVTRVFLEVEPALLRGEATPELLKLTTFGPAIERAKQLASKQIFSAPSVLERLLGGQRVLRALLELLTPLVDELAGVDFERSRLAAGPLTKARLLGEGYAPRDRYSAMLGITDFVSGLTDRAAVSLYRRLSGHGL